MATFIMLGKYTSESLKGISPERTDQAVDLIKKCGGEVKSIYALLGKHDLIVIVDYPGVEQAMKASIALNKLTGIAFTTSQAISVEEFDKMMTEI
ncbi:MAG: GYD domain-containing protein [Desulfobacteraceae bacterium]|uniref:GYD domain-containing protein n=1 Tax=Candidatus Desulfaltia bathyphila TaxID=2841697 RepID=A0A8J6N3S8_9BACT|nr:GYD domain-containing protein [Candidatus Desulfaltia bathyphila]